MTLRPQNGDDGPVEVHFIDGTTETYSHVWHNQSGTVTFYDVVRPDDTNAVKKGDRAIIVPRERIEKIEFTAFGPDHE